MAKFKPILIASAAFLLVPAFASAQNYYQGYNSDTECQQSVNNAQTAGGLGGAIAGAAIGSNLASKGVRKEGAVLGAVLGAVVGSSIGKNRIACDDKYEYQQQQQYYNQSQYNNGYYDNNNRPYYSQQQNYGNQNYYGNQGYYGNSQYNSNSYYGDDNYYSSNYGQYQGYKKGHHKHHWDSVSYPNNWNMQGNCGYGQAAYRLPNGTMAYQQVYMCRKPNGGWSVVE